MAEAILLVSTNKGRTIRKVMGGGGGGKNKKKIHARENAKKRNSCKEEGKEKKFMQKVWVSEINNITRNNMNKQKSLSSSWKETIRTLFLF